MNRSFLAATAGAATAAALVAIPLMLQQRRAAASLRFPSRGIPANATAPTPPETVLWQWKAVQETGSKADAELRAAESVQHLSAAECRAAAEQTLAAGDKSPLADLLGRWASLDGKEAFAWLAEHPELLDGVIDNAGPAWAASDPAGYAAWLPGYRVGPEAKRSGRGRLPEFGADYMRYKSSHWLAAYDLPAAIRITMEKVHAAGISHLYINRTELSPFIRTAKDAEALGAEIAAHPEWATDLPREKSLRVLVALRECWQDLDPDGWDRWAEAHPLFAAKAENEPVRPALTFLRARDPQAAADKILATAPPEKQAETLDGLMRLWTETDLNAAGTWLSAQPESPEKWNAVQTFALAAVKDDPEAALQWAASIPDSALQARARRRVLAHWADTDPDAASAWLSSSGWSGSQLQAARDILAAGKPGGPEEAPVRHQ
ncbi:MAG: hypothetical protein V4726_02700 [Verrucomicrobiota bacterium]